MKHFIFFKTRDVVLCVCIAAMSLSSGTGWASTLEDVLETITAGDLMSIVTHLASPDYAGRLPGDDGFNRAAVWVAGRFDRCGLKPAGDGGTWFQHFDVEYNRIDGPAVLGLVVNDTIRRSYEIGTDFVARGFTGQGLMTAPVVFCGFGISSPGNKYDDYQDVDVTGCIVLIFKGVPEGDGEWTDVRMPRVKANTARRHGAVGMLLVSEPGSSRSDALVGSVYHGPGEHPVNFPAFHVSQSVASEFLGETELTLDELYTRLTASGLPSSFPLGVAAHIEIHASYTKQIETMNVIGYREGTDPDLKDQVVIVGAHLDHVGPQAGAIYFPGANDNASGVAAVIEIAEAMAGMENGPGRSILFIAFAAEEQGMLGSYRYVNNPVFQLEKTTAMINIDCIGSGEGMRIGGGEDCPDLFSKAVEMNDRFLEARLPASGRGGGADAEPFYEQNIPTLYFATTSGYAHLHQITDTPETLNPPLFEKAARLAFLTVWKTASE